MYNEVIDEKGYRFYWINGTKKKTHPLLIKIINDINSKFSEIKFSTYRCMLKLQFLKKELNTYNVSYQSAFSIIQKHVNKIQESIPPMKLIDILHDIFYMNEKSGLYMDRKSFNLTSSVNVLANFFWNVFDPKRSQNLNLMDLKLALLIICDVEPFQQIISDHFEIIKDFNNNVTSARFEEFIGVFGKLLSYLGEPLYFNQKITVEILKEAFAKTPGLNGINQHAFNELWMSQENTNFSVYTNIFLIELRFKKSQYVIHQNQCGKCNQYPIIGMLYKCQKCKGLVLCFDCFSKGYTTKQHSLAHRFFEISSNEKQRRFCSILTKFFNLFRRQNNIVINQSLSELNHQGTSKLIENDHVELINLDSDIDFSVKRYTTRSEVYNNSENLLILQRKFLEKFSNTIENLKEENDNFKRCIQGNISVTRDPELRSTIKNYNSHLNDQIEVLKQIHEAATASITSSQNNKTIKSFSSPAKSIFLPSSTPYDPRSRTKKQLVFAPDAAINKSINGYELNKSYVATSNEFSITDLSTFFQTKMTKNALEKNNYVGKKPLDNSESKLDNFRELLVQLKEVIDDSYSDNVELARTTENFTKVLDKIIEKEAMKRASDGR